MVSTNSEGEKIMKYMDKKGLIIGKFYPIHIGHISLIETSAKQCEQLIVEMQYMKSEKYIDIELRKSIFELSLAHIPNIIIKYREYVEEELPSTSESSIEISRKWAKVLKDSYPDIYVIFGSEEYVNFLADFMNIPTAVKYNRNDFPISSTKIRNEPYKHWQYMVSGLKPKYAKNYIICGTESTYKSTISKMLSEHFDLPLVIETARENGCESSQTCTIEQLENNVITQTDEINKIKNNGQMLMISDTCPLTTKSYAKFLFNHDLQIPPVNENDVFLFMMPDAPFFQDGTRLLKEDRDKLHEFHLDNYSNTYNEIHYIKGSLEERFQECVSIIQTFINTTI